MSRFAFHFTPKLSAMLVCFILLFQLTVQIYLAKTDSQTTDEAVHLTAGLTYLTRHDWRWNPEHPPLVKMLAAAPVLLLQYHEPIDIGLWANSDNYFYDSWRENREYGERFMYQSGNDADRILFWARVPIIMLTLMLGLVIFYVAALMFGRLGGLVSLVVYSLDPTVMAHGHLITTDIGLSLGFIGSLWALWRWLDNKSWKRIFVFAIILGLTELIKFTAVILYPIILLILIWHFWYKRPKLVEIKLILGQILIALIIIWTMTIAAYGFDFKSAPTTDSVSTAVIDTLAPQYHHLVGSPKMQKVDKIYSWAHQMFIPRYYIKGLVMIFIHVGGGHSSFLLGSTSNTGWWYYFPILLLAKLPLSVLGLIIMSAIYVIRQKNPDTLLKIIIIGGASFLLFSMTSKANLGIRHVLPVMIVVFILAGAALKGAKNLKIASGLLLITLMISSLRVLPHPMAFMNSFFGGTDNTYNIANDSNLDWGQDLHRIKTYIDKNKIKQPYIEYTWAGQSSLDYYSFDYRPILSSDEVKNGVLIIGASGYQASNWRWLHSLKPIDRITPAVFVFNLDDK